MHDNAHTYTCRAASFHVLRLEALVWDLSLASPEKQLSPKSANPGAPKDARTAEFAIQVGSLQVSALRTGSRALCWTAIDVGVGLGEGGRGGDFGVPGSVRLWASAFWVRV